MPLSATITAKCDHCGKTVKYQVKPRYYDEGEFFMPDGWFANAKTKKIYHSEKCLMATMTEEEREAHKNSIWMA